MKKIIPVLLITSTFLAMGLFTGCDNTDKKMDDVKSAEAEANENMQKKAQELLQDMDKFRKNVDERFATHGSIINKYKASLVNERKT